MTDRELLELIVKRLDNFEDAMKTEISDMKTEISDMKTEISDMKTEISDMKTEISDMKTEMSDMKSNMDNLQNAQKRTEATLENTVDKCIQVLYESHTLNAERFDKFDIESIKRNSDLAVTIAKAAYEMASKKAV